MQKLLVGLLLAGNFIVVTSSSAEHKLATSVRTVPEPAITTMHLTPTGEVLHIEFEDGKIIEEPELLINDMLDIDLIEIYNLPFDYWSFETNSGKIRRGWRSPLSYGCSFIYDADFYLHLGADAMPYKITDIDGNEIPFEEDFLANFDEGRMTLISYRTFTLIDYSANGEPATSIIAPSALGNQ